MMNLAFSCGKWDWVKFSKEITPQVMDGWFEFFRQEPQGQYHKDRMLALASSMICAASNAEIEPGKFLYYERQDEKEELSVDDAWEECLHLIPISQTLAPEVKINGEHRRASDTSNDGREPVPGGGDSSEVSEQCPIRIY